MGAIERYGGGIKRITNDCDKNGNAHPTWSDRQGEFVTEYHPRRAVKKEMVQESGFVSRLVARAEAGDPRERIYRKYGHEWGWIALAVWRGGVSVGVFVRVKMTP